MLEQTKDTCFYHLFLDESKESHANNTVICRNMNEFINIIEKQGLPATISFGANLGKDGAEWLVNHCIKNRKRLPKYTVHTSNPIGAFEIKSVLETFERYFHF